MGGGREGGRERERERDRERERERDRERKIQACAGEREFAQSLAGINSSLLLSRLLASQVSLRPALQQPGIQLSQMPKKLLESA